MLPAVASTSVPPGFRRPAASASRTIASAIRSLLLPPGLRYSAFARISQPVAAESERKWADQNEKWAEQNRKWEESKAESDRKWAEQTEQNRRLWLEVGEQKSRLDRKIGAQGARWGIVSERAFRQALAALLTESFGVEVLNIKEYDDAGEVFGRPVQIELDIIVRNGTLIIFELKSSTDRSQLYIFSRKIAFCEKRHQLRADRKILVSPFIHPHSQELAQELGIETYGDSTDVELELS